MAIDAQEAAAKPSPSLSQRRWAALKARVEARAAAVKPKRRAAALA